MANREELIRGLTLILAALSSRDANDSVESRALATQREVLDLIAGRFPASKPLGKVTDAALHLGSSDAN